MSDFAGCKNYCATDGGVAISSTHQCVCCRSPHHLAGIPHLCPCSEKWRTKKAAK